jgi:hypothetical protein
MCLDVCACVLDYIMHNAYTQAHHNLAYCVHNPRRDLVYLVVHMIAPTYMSPRRDRIILVQKYSRDRSRRT